MRVIVSVCAAALLLIAIPPAFAQGLYYKEITKDGRIYVFNVAANASNNDDSPLGDYIYVKAIRSSPSR